MSDDGERQVLIAEILRVRAERAQLQERVEMAVAHRSELNAMSESQRAAIADQASRELAQLDDERAFISGRSVQDEEFLRGERQLCLSAVMAHKEAAERRLETESEFVAGHLRGRLVGLDASVVELRTRAAEKARAARVALAEMAPDEALDLKLKDNREECAVIARKIAESHREIEGLAANGQQLRAAYEGLARATAHWPPSPARGRRPRSRSNATAPRPPAPPLLQPLNVIH